MIKSPIPRPALDQNAIVLGKTRSGKSSAMRFLVEGLLKEDKAPPCIVDPKGDWWGIKLSADGRGAGFPLIVFGGAHADIEINDRSGAYIAELVATGNRPCLIDLGGWRVKERTRFFIDFASTLFRMLNHSLYLVIDECHNFAPKGKLFDPEAAEMLHWANRLASEGLGKGLMLLSASQRPQKVHNDYLTSHETLIAKRVIHKADRDALRDWIDGCGDPALGKEVIGSIAQMQRSEAWGWSPEIGFGPKRIEFPFFETYDSFKPQTAQTLGKLKGWASVDLDDVRSKLSKVVEEAKENDPKALKARIVQLTAELAKKPAAAPAEEIISETSRVARNIRATGYEEGRAIGREEGYLVGHHVGAGLVGVVLKYAADHIKGVEAELIGALGEAQSLAQAQDFTEERAGFDGVGGETILRKLKKQGQAPAPHQAPAPLKLDEAQNRISPDRIAMPRSMPPQVMDGSLGTSKQKILDVLAWWESIGRTTADKDVIAFLAGVSPKSSGHQNNMGALRTAGLIEYPGPGQAGLTPEGRVRASAPAAVLDSAALQAGILAKLNPPMRAILETLLDAHARTKEQLAKELGVSANSSGHQNNLGRLRSLGFIIYPVPGQVAVSPSMFI